MLKRSKLVTLSLIFIFSTNFIQLFASDVPIIVIAPSKKAQSTSTVGTSVTVLDEDFFKNSNELFLGNALANTSTSANFFQNGGQGQTSAIQLRGLPKRYSTVYIDGVKMSDPSSVSNDYDFNHILTSQISRVEILKGNQSSVYGSGAIGGTINITTKKGEPGFQKNVQYNTASHGTHNLSVALSGADENDDFYVGLERFQTDGISAMTHNDEKDKYRNNSLIAKYGRKITEKIKFESNIRFTDTYSQYDKEVSGASYDNSESVDADQSSSHIAFIYEPNNKFTNKFTFANTYVERKYHETPNSGNTAADKYYGDRYSMMYTGNYNFNLDNSVAFGLEREDDQIGYNKNLAGRTNHNANITSGYFDIQNRVTNNFYVTYGARLDKHSRAFGKEASHRTTAAYLFDDKSTKLKSSYGTGFRFPSLYEQFYLYSFNPSLGAENSRSFDFGIEKSFSNLGLNLDVSYFDIKYSNVLEGWKGAGSWSTENFPGDVKSRGLELISNWMKSETLNFGLNYTLTNTYDGAEQDDPDINGSYTNDDLVRVPKHMLNLITNVKVPGYKDLDLTLRTKWSGTARDYGNGNRTYRDEMLDDYLVNDLSIKYKLWNSYNIFFDINNILDEKYETVRDYSQMDRSFNFGIRRKY